MKILICDDEKYYLDKIADALTSILRDSGETCSMIRCEDGFRAIEHCGEDRIDAVILDIAMPGLSGFEVARRLQQKHEDIALLFISSKEDLVFYSYEYHPFWFVPKSQLIRLPEILRKFIAKIKEKNENNAYLRIPIHNAMLDIDLRKTLYFESDNHNVKMVFDEYSTSFREKISELDRQLADHWFVRCHQGYLVNCRKIREISGTDLVLENERKVPISRSRLAETKKMFQSFLRSERW